MHRVEGVVSTAGMGNPLRTIIAGSDKHGDAILEDRERDRLKPLVDSYAPWRISVEERETISSVLRDHQPRHRRIDDEHILYTGGSRLLQKPQKRLDEVLDGHSKRARFAVNALLAHHQDFPENKIFWRSLKEPEDWKLALAALPTLQHHNRSTITKEWAARGLPQEVSRYVGEVFTDPVERNAFLREVYPNGNEDRSDFTTIEHWQREYERWLGQSTSSIKEWEGGESFVTAFMNWRKSKTSNPKQLEKLLYEVFLKPRARYGCPDHEQVGFDSIHERAIALVLCHIQLLTKLREGHTVHVPTSPSSQTSIDFRLHKKGQNVVWLEFHPENGADRMEGPGAAFKRKSVGIPEDEPFVFVENIREFVEALLSGPLHDLLHHKYEHITEGTIRELLTQAYRAGYEYDKAHPVKQRALFTEDQLNGTESAVEQSLWANLVTEPGRMSQEARSYMAARPYLTEQLCRKWGVGFVPKHTGGKHAEQVVYAYDTDDEQQHWVGRNPLFDAAAQSFELADEMPEEFLFPDASVFQKDTHLWGEHLMDDPARQKAIALHGLTIVQQMDDVMVLDWFGVPACAMVTPTLTEAQAQKIARWAEDAGSMQVKLMFPCDEYGDECAGAAAEQLRALGIEAEIVWSAQESGSSGFRPMDLRTVADVQTFFPQVNATADVPAEATAEEGGF